MTTGKSVLGATAMAMASTLRATIQIAALPIIGRILGPHAYGQMALVIPFILFANLLAESGLGTCIVRAERLTKELEGSIFCFSAGFSLFIVILFATLAYPVGHMLREPLFPALLLGMSTILPLATLNIVPMALLLRDKRYNWIALTDVVSTLGSVTAVSIGIFLNWGVWSLVAQQITFWVCKVTVVTIGSRSRPQFYFDLNIIKENISFGANLTAASALSFIANNIDNVLIGASMGTETLGYYALATQIVTLPATVMRGSVYYTVLSGTSEAWRKGDSSPDGFMKALRGVLLLSAPAMIGLGVTAPLSIPFILGDRWLPIVPILICLVPLGLTQALWLPIWGILVGMGRADLIFKLGLIGSATTIAAILLGVHFGSIAVALGVSIAGVIILSYTFRITLQLFSTRPKRVLWAITVPLIAASSMGCVVIVVQETLFTGLPLAMRLTVSIGVGILAYGLILAGLFRDHISDDLAVVKTALFSR